MVVGGELHGLNVQFLIRGYFFVFWTPEHFEWTQPEQQVYI